MILLFISYISIDFKHQIIQNAAKLAQGNKIRSNPGWGRVGLWGCCGGEHSPRCDYIKAVFHFNGEGLERSQGTVAPPDLWDSIWANKRPLSYGSSLQLNCL